jgi:hypothetical protein
MAIRHLIVASFLGSLASIYMARMPVMVLATLFAHDDVPLAIYYRGV